VPGTDRPPGRAGRRIVVGVGGSVAAWKACDLVSKLVQKGDVVDVVLTEHAQWFVKPLAFSALTQRKVHTDAAWGEGDAPAEHLAVTQGADLLVVAPCTANLVGKFAHGLADDILSTTWLGVRCPRMIAPAMNVRMGENARVRANVETLRADGVEVVGPAKGWLAEGETGEGRMVEVADLLAAVDRRLAPRS
jgi:phosphopantothenoylcysteine decarboxylase/phosphopantothenate--cysteine ligase